VAWKLCDSRTLLVATAGYLRRRGTPAHPSELAAHDCLSYLRTGPASWSFEQAERGRAAREPQRISVRVQGPLRANNSELLRDAVLSGLGIAQIPDFSVAAALKSGRLREVLPAWRPVGFFGDAIYAMRPWSPHTPRAVQVLVEHLRSALAGGFGASE
jgi:DNA-binding transcriptional LysR family regulator